MSNPQKRLAVDIGGTFTDIVIEAGDKRWTRKLLTTPQAPEQAVIAGTLELLAEIGIAPGEIDLFIHGTTLATNAIIERKGAVTALIATEGFRDILDIADEGRYDQYDIFIDKPKSPWSRASAASPCRSASMPRARCCSRSTSQRCWRCCRRSTASALQASPSPSSTAMPMPAMSAASARSWPRPGPASPSPSRARSAPRCANMSAPPRPWPMPMSSR